jgi:putative FmdB family regulatory protein
MGLKMPIYEFRCSSCGQKVSIYQQRFATISHSCPKCGNRTLERIFSPFSISKTDKKVYEEIRSDCQFEQALKRNDPRALAEWVKRTSRGDKISPECEETIGKLAKGELPAKGSKPSGSK